MRFQPIQLLKAMIQPSPSELRAAKKEARLKWKRMSLKSAANQRVLRGQCFKHQMGLHA